MTIITPPTGSGNPQLLTLLEQRVTNDLLVQIANTADNNLNVLRNDNAPVLGVAVPVPSP